MPMKALRWIGVMIAVGAAGHVGVRAAVRWWRNGRRFLADCLVGWMDGLDDLAPGRLAHGQEGGETPAD